MPNVNDRTVRSVFRSVADMVRSIATSAGKEMVPALIGSFLAHKMIKDKDGEEVPAVNANGQPMYIGLNPRIKRAFMPALIVTEAEEARFNNLWNELDEDSKDSLRPRLARLDDAQYKDFMISVLEILLGVEGAENGGNLISPSTDLALETLRQIAAIENDIEWLRECVEIRRLFKSRGQYITLSNAQIHARLIARRLGIPHRGPPPAPLPPGPGAQLWHSATTPRGNIFRRILLP